MKTLFMTVMISVCPFYTNIRTLNNEKVLLMKREEAAQQSIYELEIRQVLNEEGIEPFTVELIVAQSKFESGNYKNSLVKYNNIFARHYFKADTFATSAGATAEGHSRFAKYPSIRHATLSQLWYFRRKNYSFKWESVYQFAFECKKRGYYEAPLSLYVKGLNRYMPNDLTK